MFNVEIKASCTQLDRLREILLAQPGIRIVGTDHQTDTYFKVPSGRMKLRQGPIENALIFYQRSNQAAAKRADVWLHTVAPAESQTLRQLLQASLGILVVVDKKREIFFIDNVKFHLDRVTELGTFVEIEAIDREGTIGEERLREQCLYYQHLLDIAPDDLLTHSYSDLLLERSAK